MLTDFKFIEPKGGRKSYAALVGRPWARTMNESISLEKERIKLKGQGKNIIIPLESKEGKPWEEPNDLEGCVRHLYQAMQSNSDTIEPEDRSENDLGSPMSTGCNSDSNLYNWELEKYESYAKYYWTIEAIPKHQVCMHQVCTCYSISLVSKIFEKKIKEYPTLIPIDIGYTNLSKLIFKETDSPEIHVNEVTKSIGDQGRL